MSKCTENIDIHVSESYASAHNDVLHVLLWGYTSIDGFSPRQMECMWLTAAVHICDNCITLALHIGRV